MKETTKELILQIGIGFCVIVILMLSIILVLNQFSPFKECENKPDSYSIKMGDSYVTCGELRAINTTISKLT